MPDSFHGGAGSAGPPLYDWMDAEVPDGRLLIGPTRGLPDSLRRYSLLHAGVPIWREPHVVGYINGLDEIGRARLRVALQSVEYHATNEDLPTRAGRALGNGTLTAVLIPRAVPPLVVPRTTISPAQGDGDPPGEPAQWSVTDRVAAMLRRTIPHLPRDMQQAAKSLFTLENLYALAGFLVIWAAGHAAGYGEAIDLALLVIGYAMVGFSVFSGLNDLGHGVAMATTAKTQRDLDEAAKRTAAGLTTLTINALLALLTKLMPKAASGKSAPREEAPPPPPRDPPLPPKTVEAPKPPEPEIKSLKERFPKEVNDASTFRTLGVGEKGAAKYMATPEGQRLLSELSSADPMADEQTILRRATDLLRSGSNLPKMENTSSSLIKIVPQGEGVTPYSPFFTTEQGLKDAASSGKGLSDYFALPAKSDATLYDIYQISPKSSVDSPAIFINNVAPTSELGGLVQHPGGAIQYLVPNRGLWSNPVKIGTIGN
ncbi:MAG: hypothetical protein PW843_27915 [Azospirillaceae bacterium]|nr:hypothetical protein [Azospirillaceae bacterium]